MTWLIRRTLHGLGTHPDWDLPRRAVSETLTTTLLWQLIPHHPYSSLNHAEAFDIVYIIRERIHCG